MHVLRLHVLATDDTWHAPSLIAATVQGAAGRALFSQVGLYQSQLRTMALDTVNLIAWSLPPTVFLQYPLSAAISVQ